MKPSDPNEDPALEQFERRKRFTRFSAKDAAALRDMGPSVEAAADDVVAGFYDHILQFEPLRRLLSDPATMERLRGFQREYVLSLTSGEYGKDYHANRLAIGKVHERIGLDPGWYLGAYALYFELLAPIIRERHANDAGAAVEVTTALTKLMILDMQLVLDAYYGIREKHAVERSEQLAAVGELAASIAHEVRNPLAGMKGAMQVLRKDLEAKPGNHEIVDEVLAQIERLEHLVHDLLTYARPQVVRGQRFDLHEMLDRMQRLYQKASDSQGVTVVREYGPDTGEIYADPIQIEQVFLNLVHNAMQSMEAGGQLSIVTRVAAGRIEIVFRDTGKGIDPAHLPRVFQPFFTTRHRGSGLGLSIVAKIVKAHGGAIDIESEPGQGTAVTVRIPIRGSD